MAALALVWDLIARDGASPTFNRVAVSADRAAASTAKAETGVMSFGKKAGAALAAFATIDFAVHITKDAAKFQQAMLLIQTNANASASEVKNMSKAVLGMAASVGTAPIKLADALYHVEQNGLRGSKALEALKAGAEGAKIGLADVEDTTNTMTIAVASGIHGMGSLQKAMGTMIAIAGTGDMRLKDLNEALSGGILSVAKGYGASLQDVAAVLATLGDNGIRGAEAATSLRQVLMGFAQPAAKGKAALDNIGLSMTSLRDDMESHGLVHAMNDLEDHMKAAGVTGSKVGGFITEAFGKKAGAGLSVLMGEIDRLNIKFKEGEKGGAGFAAKWEATTKTASFQFSKLGAMAEVAGIQIGTKLLPYVTEAATWLGTELPHAAGLLRPAFENIGSAIASVWKVIQPLVKLVGGALIGAFLIAVKVATALAEGLSAVAGFLKDNATIVRVVIGAYVGLRVAELALAAAAKIAMVAQVGLDAAMAVNPIVAVTAAVVALGLAYQQLGGFSGAATKISAGFDVITGKTGKVIVNYRTLGDVFDKSTVAGATAAIQTQKLADANYQASHMVQYNIDAHGRLVATMVKSGSALDNTSAAMTRQTEASKILKNAIDILNGVNETVEQTQDAMTISLGNLTNKTSLFKDANGNMSASLSKSTIAGATNRTMLTGIIDQAKAAAQAVADHARQQGVSLPAALAKGNASLKAQESALRAAAVGAGFNKTQVDYLINSIGHLAKLHVKPSIDVNVANAINNIRRVGNALESLHNKTIVMKTISTSSGNVTMKAAGGYVSGPGSGTSDSIPAMLSNGEFVVNAAQTRKHGSLLRSINSGVRGFAAGGAVKHDYSISGSDTIYASQNAASNAAHAALKAILTLGIRVDGKDLANFRDAIKKTASEARTAFKTLYADAAKAGALSQQVMYRSSGLERWHTESLGAALKQQEHELEGAINARTATVAKLATLRATMAQLASSVSGAITGFFDVGQAGANPVTGAITGLGIEAQQRQALNQIREFSNGIKTLESRHLNKAYLMQIASQGPSALPQVKALLSLNAAGFADVNRTEASIAGYGTSLGTSVSQTVYGKQAADLAAQERSETRLANKIGKVMAKEVRGGVKEALSEGIEVRDGGKVLFDLVHTAGKQLARR